MFNKYSDFHFSYNFYRTKVWSLSCKPIPHPLNTWMMKKFTQSYWLISKGTVDRMEGLNRRWKWSFINNFETEIKLKSTYRAPPLNLIFLMILKLEQAQRRIFCQHFNVEVLLKININLIEAWDVVKSENVLLDPNSGL